MTKPLDLVDLLNQAPFSALPSSIKVLMTDGLFKDTVLPVFGSNRFPIKFYTNAGPNDEGHVLEALIAIRKNLTLEQCEEWNQALYRKTGSIVPNNLQGNCVSVLSDAKARIAKCRATPDKWSCEGCGKSWVPGSYMSKNCVSHPDPKWRVLLQPELDQMIEDMGVSKEAPIVWNLDGGKRLFKPKSSKT